MDLQENCSSFIRLYEEHQPELQQIITAMLMSIEEFLDDCRKAAQGRGGIRMRGLAAAALGAGVGGLFVGIGALLATITGAYWGALETVVLSAVGTGMLTTVGVLEMFKAPNKPSPNLKDLPEDIKKFKTTASRISSPLKYICKHVENLLQNYDEKDLRDRADELFNPEDLRTLSVQVEKTLEMIDNIQPSATTVPHPTEDPKTLRDVNKLKILSTVLENELESETGRFVWRTREMINHLQETLNQLRFSKAGVEKVLSPKLGAS